jgi:cell shape-determining protein MreC
MGIPSRMHFQSETKKNFFPIFVAILVLKRNNANSCSRVAQAPNNHVKIVYGITEGCRKFVSKLGNFFHKRKS